MSEVSCIRAHSAELLTVAQFRDRVQGIIDRGGPTLDEYQSLDSWLFEADRLVKEGCTNRQELQRIWLDQGDTFLWGTMQGFALLKPHGYAGDFEMIDRIYTGWSSPHAHLARWDAYFHAQSAPKAVRNRKQVFRNIVEQCIAENSGLPIHVLNLGSGPCRDVLEVSLANPDGKVTFDCVDQDPNAISYATRLLEPISSQSRIHFYQSNVLRFRPRHLYDLIWSAGLFDYLSDRCFITLLSRMNNWVGHRGRMVIGNFSSCNPSRPYMEIVGNWILHHRDETTLRELADRAGITSGKVSTFGEAEGVNLFLQIK
jgi:extracellular factor (EF) 3-hydroxypalmitic acid methyl ester biosynthesis protein